jgi:hypothetical protein
LLGQGVLVHVVGVEHLDPGRFRGEWAHQRSKTDVRGMSPSVPVPASQAFS